MPISKACCSAQAERASGTAPGLFRERFGFERLPGHDAAGWRRMREAGVKLGVALPLDNPLRTLLTSRIDLRNHRKIVVIDDRITYCGSQNCADPEFRIRISR